MVKAMQRKKQNDADEAVKRINAYIGAERKEYKKEQRRKIIEELCEDLPILLLCVVIPGIVISLEVDILHGAAYGITFLIGYGIGKSRSKAKK